MKIIEKHIGKLWFRTDLAGYFSVSWETKKFDYSLCISIWGGKRKKVIDLKNLKD